MVNSNFFYIQKQIIINTSFSAFHYWADAPKEFSFLRNVHRHIFYVELLKTVDHSERDIEFIDYKNQVDDYIAINYKHRTFPFSCEHIAEALLHKFEADQVKITEDNENGAVVKKC